MKGVVTIAVIVVVVVLLFGFVGCNRIGPGYVGVKVTLTGQGRGVQDFPLRTGWVFYNRFTESVMEYPTFIQTAQWTKDGRANEEITFSSKEGLGFTADISLSYQLDPERVPYFYVKFRNDDLDTFTHGFLRNVARDKFNEVAGHYPVEDIYGPKKDELLAAVKKAIIDAVKNEGVLIEQFGFIGNPRPPEQVVASINSKIAATQAAQQAENELRKATAEAQKRIAAAEGEARSNEILTRSLSPTLLQWRQLEIQELAIHRWDGKRPMVEGGNASGFIFQLPK